MKMLMAKILSVVLLCALWAAPLFAGEWFSYVNPHWATEESSCLQCHDKVPEDDSDLGLKYNGDINLLCNRCHITISKDKYIHSSGMLPTQAMLEKMPEDFLGGLNDEGKITCAVCHEMKYQCLSEEFHRRKDNRLFHRGAPYEKRTDLCYNCHQRNKYKKFNPHNQINDEGELDTEVCTYCHDRVPDRKTAKSIADVSFDSNRVDKICLRCHTNDAYAAGCVMGFEENGSPIYHAAKPDAEMVKRMGQREDEAILPLELVTGNVFCGTCHNPHELGVQPRNEANIGADAHKRLRIGKENSKICLGCHDTKDLKKFQLP